MVLKTPFDYVRVQTPLRTNGFGEGGGDGRPGVSGGLRFLDFARNDVTVMESGRLRMSGAGGKGDRFFGCVRVRTPLRMA